MKRLCIFCFFDKEGTLDRSVEYILKELSENTDRMVIAVNGIIKSESKKKLLSYGKEIIERPNVGYDAGAYKQVLFQYLTKDEIKKYDELILCNDTFIGPFVPLASIFDAMEKRECDYWGITGVDWTVFPHIQSYFLVFKEKVLKSDSFYEYWCENISASTQDLEDVYAQFETGLFYYLTQQKGIKFDTFIPANNCSIYESVYTSLKKYETPLIKKKSLRALNNHYDDVMAALQYVIKENCYPIEIIIDYIERVCGISLTRDDILQYCIDEKKITEHSYIELETTTEKLKKRINESLGFYIYGCGVWGRRIYWNLCKNNRNFKGFVVSDEATNDYKQLYGYDVFQIDQIDITADIDIVMGVNRKNTIEIVSEHFSGTDNHKIISLFPDAIKRIQSSECL